MAVCVGCGLEVNNGILEVNVCGTVTGTPTASGGLRCDPTNEGGCLSVVLNDSHVGCGLKQLGGALSTNNCVKGGILCGPTSDDTTQCNYVNVLGQGAGPCIVTVTDSNNGFLRPGLGGITDCSRVEGSAQICAGVPTGAPSPNCNGLERTCDGLWAPPAIPSINFSCGQLFNFARTPMSNFVQPIGPQAGLVAGSSDGFPPYSNDVAYGTSGSEVIIINAFALDKCLDIDAMSWTAFTMNFEVKPGELWRFGLHERICFGGAALLTEGNLCTNPWALQSVQYVDARGNNALNIGSVQINDNSTWRFGPASGANTHARMEAMITFSRLIGAGPLNNAVVAADFQYRNMGHGFHHRVDQTCGFSDTTP